MLAWSEGTDNGRQKTRNRRRHCRRRAGRIDLPHHPRKLVTLNPNSNQQAPDATSFFLLVDVTASSLAWKTSLRKVRTLWALQQIKERGANFHDWSWWYPSGNRPLQQYLGLTAWRAGYVLSPYMADSLIAKFKEAGGTVREIDVWAESPRLSPLWLSASSSACHGLICHHVITPATSKAQRDKNARELKLANAAITDMQMRQRICARWQIHQKELADAKAEMMLCVMMLPLVVVGCTSKQSVSQCVKPPPPPAWIMQPPPTGRHRWTGLFHPQREADHYAKQLEGTQKYIKLMRLV